MGDDGGPHLLMLWYRIINLKLEQIDRIPRRQEIVFLKTVITSEIFENQLAFE